jgi:septal ring factor EnvC (AmiA/AmiB activator)
MIRLALILMALAGPLLAQGETAAAARAAADRLTQARAMLDAATGGSDQISALTETVAAYEDGLAALREGLRRAAIRQQTVQADLDARREEIAGLLAVLQSIGRTPEPVLLLHPTGPLGTARSGMILADVTPALQAQAEELRLQLAELAEISALQQDALTLLQDGLDGTSAARAALAQAVQDRTDLPRRFTEDAVGTATLLASSETLAAFADGLGVIVDQDLGGTVPDAGSLKGTLPLPVPASILRRAGQADAAGVVRPGLVLATAPGALVTAPAAATVRFQGDLLDYGQVVILEPAPGVLLVLAGLGQVLVQTGQVLPAGALLGLMGGTLPQAQAILTETVTGAGAARSETLYLEVRDGQGSVDPADWFVLQ